MSDLVLVYDFSSLKNVLYHLCKHDGFSALPGWAVLFFFLRDTPPRPLSRHTKTKKKHIPRVPMSHTRHQKRHPKNGKKKTHGLRMSSKDIGSKAITQRSRRLNLASNPPAEDDFHHGRPPPTNPCGVCGKKVQLKHKSLLSKWITYPHASVSGSKYVLSFKSFKAPPNLAI